MHYLRHLLFGLPFAAAGDATQPDRAPGREDEVRALPAKRPLKTVRSRSEHQESAASREKVVFAATGTIQRYPVPGTGTYLIEAAGGQGGPGDGPGAGGARLSGVFLLKGGDVVKVVVGRRGAAASSPQLPGGQGGSSMVWTGSSDLPAPIKLMLSARGGDGGAATSTGAVEPGPPPDAKSVGPAAGLETDTVDVLRTQWTGAGTTAKASASRGQSASDQAGYNAGAFRTGVLGAQMGDGYVSITPVSTGRPASTPSAAEGDGALPHPDDRGTSAAPDGVPPAVPARTEGDGLPSPTLLPPVLPRQPSWSKFLRKDSPPRRS